MTHAISFSVAAELKEAFEKQCASDLNDAERVRAFKVRINEEAFTLAAVSPWGSEDSALALAECKALMMPSEACYLIFKNSHDASWILMSFVPDEASVREKMLYSSSIATLKRAFGGGDRISSEVHWSSLEEVSLGFSALDNKKDIMTATERLAIAEDHMVAMEQAESSR